MIKRLDFVLPGKAKTKEWKNIKEIADRFECLLNQPDLLAKIKSTNLPGTSSGKIQNLVLPEAESVGFRSEENNLFRDYGLALRPDYFMKVNKTGILLEVERGKTTNNNMDLLDLWKCHICPVADYLFLLVPVELRQNGAMRPKMEFNAVGKRMATFFEERNQINVRGMVLLGY